MTSATRLAIGWREPRHGHLVLLVAWLWVRLARVVVPVPGAGGASIVVAAPGAGDARIVVAAPRAGDASSIPATAAAATASRRA
jgi:hypothetical protein